MLKNYNIAYCLAYTLYVHVIIYPNVCLCDCNRGYFKIGSMIECHPMLSCHDISKLDIGDLIGYGAVKHIYQSVYSNITVALVFINNKEYSQDFMHGLQMLREIGPSEYVVKLIGLCLEAKVYVTEYHPLGNAQNFHKIFPRTNVRLSKRFRFCIKYVKILEYLHNSPSGRRVMCDSNSLDKVLEQYLITSSHNLVINDVDALPEVGNSGIICGHKELRGTFVAPEQRWPHHGEIFSETRMKPYDEKVDIWKIPAVCNYFLGQSQAAGIFRYYIHPIHKHCKHNDPLSRPSASEVLMFYKKVFEEYFSDEKSAEHDEL